MESFFNKLEPIIFALIDIFCQPSIEEKETKEALRRKKRLRKVRREKTKRILFRLISFKN